MPIRRIFSQLVELYSRRSENERLRAEVESLRAENARLRGALEQSIEDTLQDIDRLKAEKLKLQPWLAAKDQIPWLKQ